MDYEFNKEKIHKYIKRKKYRKLLKYVNFNLNDIHLYATDEYEVVDNDKNNEINHHILTYNTGLNSGISLHCACHSVNLRMVKFLIENGVDVNGKDQYGFTPLHVYFFSFWQCHDGDLKIAKLLILNEADINIENNKGQKPFDLIMKYKRNDIIKQLVEEIDLISFRLQIKDFNM